MNQFQRELAAAHDRACLKCNGHGRLGSRVPLQGYVGTATQSREIGQRCPECGGSGVRRRV